MSGVMELGPLAEKEPTTGAVVSFTEILFKMVAVASLSIEDLLGMLKLIH